MGFWGHFSLEYREQWTLYRVEVGIHELMERLYKDFSLSEQEVFSGKARWWKCVYFSIGTIALKMLFLLVM